LSEADSSSKQSDEQRWQLPRVMSPHDDGYLLLKWLPIRLQGVQHAEISCSGRMNG
jgi:hypothetical protein